jgi:hypothetical protein
MNIHVFSGSTLENLCQHALVLITAQQSINVKMEDFVHDYYSMERFKNAYKRLIEPLPDKTQ